jgi:hypothetical protein
MAPMKKYSDGEIEFLRVNYPKMSLMNLVRAFNVELGYFFDRAVTKGRIKAIMKNHRITCGRGCGRHLMPSRLCTPQQEQFIRDNYKTRTAGEIAALFNERFPEASLSEGQIRSFTRNHKIASGRTGHFPKGHKPWNAGTKGTGLLCGPNSGSFKKGHVNANLTAFGRERTNVDGYIEVKVAERNPHTGAWGWYRQKHVVIWEQANGPVPEGKIVAFRDGDRTRCEIGNLMLVSRPELLHLNAVHYRETPEELKPATLALAKLETAAHVRTYRLKRGRKRTNVG